MTTPYDDLINAAREHAAERIEHIKQDRYGFYTAEDLADAEKSREAIEAQASALESAAFTVFCQQASGGGTIWIAPVQASTAQEAAQVGQAQCADDWGYELDDVHVLGVTRGHFEVVEWNDIGD